MSFAELFAERLRVRCVNELAQVIDAAHADDANQMVLPDDSASALVIPASEVPGRVEGAAFKVSQQVMNRVAVIIVAGVTAFDQLEPAKEAVKACLRGWSPPGAATPVEYERGQTLDYDAAKHGGRWRFALQFRFPSQDTYEHQPS